MRDEVPSSFVMFISSKLKKALKQGGKTFLWVHNNVLCCNSPKAEQYFLQSIQLNELTSLSQLAYKVSLSV